jgi:hypothetical protein
VIFKKYRFGIAAVRCKKQHCSVKGMTLKHQKVLKPRSAEIRAPKIKAHFQDNSVPFIIGCRGLKQGKELQTAVTVMQKKIEKSTTGRFCGNLKTTPKTFR